MDQTLKELKAIRDALTSIDTSLQLLAAHQGEHRRTTAFVSKRAVSQRLNIPSVAVDKLIHQGFASGGESGLVERRHYCKLDPAENNPSNYLYDSAKVLADAWNNFTGYQTNA